MKIHHNAPTIFAEAIRKSYGTQEILHGVDMVIPKHELTLITGPSGSGKTTLLEIISGLNRPDDGRVTHESTPITSLKDKELTKWRAQKTGYAFQRAGLLGGLNVANNIISPHRLNGTPIDKQWAGQLCAHLGIDQLLDKSAATLSGGEKQRVSLARALVHRPEILFADEPTAAVDIASKSEIHELMRGLVDRTGLTIALVSHDPISADYADSIVRMQDGRITG